MRRESTPKAGGPPAKAQGGPRRGTRLLLAGVAASALLATSSASASAVTVGSPLTASFSSTFHGPTTEANSALAEPGANVTSPITGTIVRWRLVVESTGAPFALRVLRPAAGGAYTGAGTSSQVTPTSTGTQTFATNLPVKAGDLIGLDLLTTSSLVGEADPVAGSTVYQWEPPLADGSTAPQSTTFSNTELGFNADVETPSNTFSLVGIRRNKKKGTATLTFNLPNPGDLAGSGKGAKVASTGAVTSKAVPAGAAALLVKAKGKKKRKLNETGKVKLNLAITYTPTGGDPGTKSVKVKLKKKL
jgi:hypothetical protein